ncbi:hypothetical protein FB192DRAFT_1447613 [Mucor lusitanicus]|uniref:Uncharacterized protein n=1 Tax=Mucor circinelloides f. lusitanicus TaxID=29924 RepID=A0A8H4BI90_MUCCL|nr:hypothetical protein FB192DRAFT_1447613 [Mucor lusitanicus]
MKIRKSANPATQSLDTGGHTYSDEVKKDIRLLQSFKNKASMFRWAFKSRRFVDLGFETEAPLLLYQRRNIDYYSIATFILHCSSCGSITQAQLKEARKMLDEIDYLKDLGIGNSAR